MRLVLDTNIVASGLLWNGAPARLIVSGDKKHLLAIKSYKNIPIVTAAEAVDTLAKGG